MRCYLAGDARDAANAKVDAECTTGGTATKHVCLPAPKGCCWRRARARMVGATRRFTNATLGA
eukprot:8118122-Alexandrium_andersonii.AAC.1